MAWDLWESSYDQDLLEICKNVQSEQQCNFSFRWGYDIIEENALNEKCCIQVLRIQIVNAEMEINELEQDLVSFQTELAFAENVEWSELFCKALRERIDNLDESVRSLRNMSRTLSELHLSDHWKPAENSKDILKALLRKYFQEKEKQDLQLVNVDTNSNTSVNSTELSETIVPSQLVSDILLEEKSGERNFPEGRHEEKKTLSSKEIKVNDEQPAHINTADSIPGYIRVENGSSDEKMQLDPVRQEPDSKDEKMSDHESPRHGVKLNVEVSQNEELSMEASSLRFFTFSNETFSIVKSLCRSDAKTNKNSEVRKEHPTTADTVEKDQARAEASNAIVEYTSMDTFIQSVVANARTASFKYNSGTSKPEKEAKRPEKDQTRVEPLELKVEKRSIEELREIVANSQKAVDAAQKLRFNLIQTPQQISKIKGNFDLKPFVAFDRSHLNAELVPQSQRAKRKPEQDPPIVGKCFPPSKKFHDALPISTYKRRKDDSVDINTNLKDLGNGKNPKKSTPLQSSRKELPKLLLSSNTNESTGDVKLLEYPRANPLTNDGQLVLVNNPDEAKWHHLKVPELKAIARKNGLTSYSKLKKNELIQFLEDKLGSRVLT